jgi:pimeloyl-ACP methyl ester carboxylesterase
MSDWVFLRGLMREQRHWGKFVEEFQIYFPDVKVHPLDLPGNGELNHAKSPSSIAGMVEVYRRQLSSRGIVPPYRILSVSMGAMVAVHWMSSYPEELDCAVLINTSMRPFSPWYQRLHSRNYLLISKLLLTRASARQWEDAILRMTTRHPREDVIQEWQELREYWPVSSLNALRQLWAAARFHVPPRKPVTKMLLLASARDSLVSVKCSKTIATSWDVCLEIHPSAGHDLTLDDGPWVAKKILNWLLNNTAA